MLGQFFIRGLPSTAALCVTVTVLWGFLHASWYVPLVLFVIAGVTFGLVHNMLRQR